MYKYFYPILVLVFISCSGTKPKMLLPEKVSPNVYEVLLENELVKVMKVSFAPGQSDNMHDHYPDDISSVFYVSTPKGSGNIVFYPNWFTHQRYSRGDTSSFTPEVGKFLIFPGTLDHAVTRNHSDEPRISLVFNFNILN